MAKVPVIVGEIGENDCGGSYIDSLTSRLNSENTSYLAWTWGAWGSCPSVLITDYAGDATPYGAPYQAILQACRVSALVRMNASATRFAEPADGHE